jgi:hypothetical protein
LKHYEKIATVKERMLMETQTSRPSRAEQLVQEIVDSLGTPFTFELLVDYIQTKRKKLLRIEERPMPVSITGKCFELADVDLILTRTGLTLDRKLHTTLHECGHILCGCVPDIWDGNPPTYDEFCRRSNEFWRQFAESLNRGTMYDDPEEQLIESVATLLRLHLSSGDSGIPTFSQSFFI